MQTPSPVAGDAPAAAEVDTRQVKGAYCKECGGWITLATMPHAETDRESQKEFARCATAGHLIKILPVAEAHAPGMCMGHKKPKGKQAELFA